MRTTAVVQHIYMHIHTHTWICSHSRSAYLSLSLSLSLRQSCCAKPCQNILERSEARAWNTIPIQPQTYSQISDGQNRQSAIAKRTRSPLASHSAGTGTTVAQMNTNCTVRIATQRVQSYEDQCLCFGGRYDRQRTLVIPITAIALASDSLITIARLCPWAIQESNSSGVFT